MRLLLTSSLLLLSACGASYAGLRGTVDLTIAHDGGGNGVARAGPVDAKACWWKDRDERSVVSLKLGPACALDATWETRSVAAYKYSVASGGSGAMLPGQACVLDLGDTKTALTVQTGVLLQTTADGPVEATIGGMTPQTPPRYVTFHFAGAPYRHGDDAWCDELAKGTGRD